MASVATAALNSPPTSPNPTRIPKPKGNRLVKSPEQGKRGKSPARGKSPERRVSLQSSPSPVAGSFREPVVRRSSLNGGIPATPPGLETWSAGQTRSAIPRPPGILRQNTDPYSISGSSPQSSPRASSTFASSASWVPGVTYVPASQVANLSTITPTREEFSSSVSDSHIPLINGLIPPEGLFGPLQQRESILRAREAERAVSMGLDTSNPSSAGDLNALLEATGLLHPPHSAGVERAINSSASASSWSPSVSTVPLSRNPSLSAASRLNESVSNHSLALGTATESTYAGSGHFRAGSEALQSRSTHSLSQQADTSISESLPSQGHVSSTDLAAARSKEPPPRPRKSSFRSTLPSLKGFKNPFSFSRSTSGSTSKDEEKSQRSKSREREPSMATSASVSTDELTETPTSSLQRSATTPSRPMNTTRASVDTIMPNVPAYQVYSNIHSQGPSSAILQQTPGSASRFGYNPRVARHSIDTPSSYTRLGQVFGTPMSGSREAIQSGYANGSREHVVAEGELAPPYYPTHGRASPSLPSAVAMGRHSPSVNHAGYLTGVTGLMRPPGLDPHIEVDERSLRTASVRTESGYGFGGIRVGSDGIILSPIEDTSPDHTIEEESEDRSVLDENLFEGEYESTIGHESNHTASHHATVTHHNVDQSHLVGDADVSLQRHNSERAYSERAAMSDENVHQQGVEAPPLPTSPARSPPQKSTETKPPTLTVPQRTLDASGQSSPLSAVTSDAEISNIERGLLGDLARQLQKLVEQQSTMNLVRTHSTASFPANASVTPGSVLRLESGVNTPSKGGYGPADEWGRWNLSDLKGAVDRMKELIEEQERRTPAQSQNGSMLSKAGPAAEPPTGNGDANRSSDVFTATPQQYTTRLEESDAPTSTKRKQSQSTSSATATSTTVVTPVSTDDGQTFPFPSLVVDPPVSGESVVQATKERTRPSLDLENLDPDLLAMLSPNHLTPSAANPPNATQLSDTTSVPMGPDVTIATVASDGFGSMRSDRSVEEILLHPRLDNGSKVKSKEDPLGEMDLEPVATSSPPKRALQASSIPTPSAAKLRQQDVPIQQRLRALTESASTKLESTDSPFGVSPVSNSPHSRAPKERGALPQFDAEKERSDGDSSSKTSLRKLFSGRAAGAKTSDTESPRSSRSAPLAQLGHARRPSSRLSSVYEGSRMARLQRSVTVGNEGGRGPSFDDPGYRTTSMHRISEGRPSFESSARPDSRTSLELQLGPRTARAFAAAGVLHEDGAGVHRQAAWRSASVLGYRRDGMERDFGGFSGTRSLASSPIPPTVGMPYGASSRRLNHLLGDHRDWEERSGRSTDSWKQFSGGRPYDSALKRLDTQGFKSDPSSAPSPTSTTPGRTNGSSSSLLQGSEPKSNRSPVDANQAAHQATLQQLKDRHELEKEALLFALAESKKEAKVTKQSNDELKVELIETNRYVEELEEKLGEAMARLRWMEKEISILKSAVGVRNSTPQRRSQKDSDGLDDISYPTIVDDYGGGRPSFDFHPGRASAETPPNRSKIYITHQEATPIEDESSHVSQLQRNGSLNSRHHRGSSVASSVAVPKTNQSMTMLLQETGYGDGLDGMSLYDAHDGSPPPSPTLVLGKVAARNAGRDIASVQDSSQLLSVNSRNSGPQTPSRNRRQGRSSMPMEMSPTTTTADYSIAPGSPGSLVLRPEDEHHLGDLLSFTSNDDHL